MKFRQKPTYEKDGMNQMNIKKPLYGVLSTAALAAAIFAVSPTISASAEGGDFDLTIMHTNDSHAHVEGYPRLVTAVNELRTEKANSLLLDAGDVFSGTLYFRQYLGQADLHFMNELGYDAMTLGNHEFDKDSKTLADFIKKMNFPMVSSNVKVTGDKDLEPLFKNEIGMSAEGGNVYPAVIKEVDGEKIGIYGLTTPDTAFISNPGENIVFEDAVEKSNSTIKMLKDKGVNKIVVLSHLGYSHDLELAEAVDGLDIIVGGHSHTTLEKPVVIDKEEPTVIVQAGEYLNLLGLLDVTFDENGVVTGNNGEVLDLKNYEANAEALAKVEEFKAPLDELKSEVVGKTEVALNGERADVRRKETNLGNLIADGMVAKANEFVKTHIAVQNGGGIRASIDAGDVTLGEVLTTLPFGNQLVTLDLTGQEIVDALEHSVAKVEGEDAPGEFLQVSGIHYKYDVTKAAGERVWRVEVMTDNGFEEIDPDMMYRVATNAFTANGGDGYTMFKDAKEDGRQTDLFISDFEVFSSYLENNNPISPVVEDRIVQEEAPEVARFTGDTRYETAVEISKKGWENADTVILARGDSFPDALAGAPLAYKHDAPILLTEQGTLNKAAKDEIKRLGAKNVIILGGKGAVSNYVKYQLEGMGLDVDRIGGDDRWETAVNIAASLGGSPEKAVVANGKNFPDALAVASYAASKGYPILLTDKDMLPSETTKALKGIDSTIVVGGEGVIGKKVYDSLPDATRYFGLDRYSTAAKIATELNPSTEVYVATGKNFADALAGSVLAAKENASMLLVQPNDLPTVTSDAIEEMKAKHFNVLGGENAVSDVVVEKLMK
ncbi:cell wall-binding repeat-containing protein [Rossellomorea vietnamensis]|uniref:Cell wall-binding repeat-containing protein n=1 Tax=Rossellomorea vietnamensis TaxID=218284 RepID=A0ACD4C460_9BACI|nr:cell wall-binding repeat-containing protein [Rossellomorea vietnamensis]UXH43400.1 cell wall-binding repeat-containing protein [Rossellomorea vietnamensis]